MEQKQNGLRATINYLIVALENYKAQINYLCFIILKGDDASQWRSPKFDPPTTLKPRTRES